MDLEDAQVSLHPQSSDPRYSNSAQKAIDGEMPLDDKKCAKTGATTGRRYLELDMKGTYPVAAVRLSRSDNLDASDNNGIVVKTKMQGGQWDQCGTNYTYFTMGRFPVFRCDERYGRYVMVELKASIRQTNLIVCELEVYSKYRRLAILL